ncbi:MAG: DUF2007 domain-containing protein [Longimonas sp.]|uniref:putative signal transducing protein n=1 Tax=Longimonas sp. TaxID=2039626 RepID=UPI0039762629
MAQLITVAQFNVPHEAHFARMQLEAAEIPCRVIHEDMTGLTMFFSSRAGGVKVQVPAGFEDEARTLLADMNRDA